MLCLYAISLLLSLTLSQSDSNKNHQHLIAITQDFLAAESPIQILARICWSRESTFQLAKSLSARHRVNIVHEASLDPLVGSSHHTFFLLDANCKNSTSFLAQAERLQLFKHPYRWIIYNATAKLDWFLGVDSRVYLIEQMDDLYEIKTVFKYAPDSELREVVLGQWSKRGDLLNREKYSFLLNRTNLMGTTVNVSFVVTNNDTLKHLWDYRDTQIDAITKLNYILVHHLKDYLNATFRNRTNSSWGYRNATTGIYSGMVGDLQLGLADLGGTPLFVTLDRTDIVEYFAATTPTFARFILRAPPLSYVTNVFTLPFDTLVWHYSFVMIAVVWACIYVIVLWEWKEPAFRVQIGEAKGTELRANFWDVIMMEIGAISQQGYDTVPRSISGRIATIFTFITLMFMYTSYSANIVALLQSTTQSIRTIEDLLNSRIKVGVEDIVYGHYYFENAQEPVRKALYQQKVAPKGQKANFLSAEEGIRKMQQGFYAFHVETSTGYKLVSEIFHENEKCGLMEIKYLNVIEPWIPARKNSTYKESMKIGMKKIIESGIQKRELRRIYTQKPHCQTGGSNFGSVGLIDCYSAFLIFASGVAIAAFLLLAEVLFMKYLIRRSLSRVQKFSDNTTKCF